MSRETYLRNKKQQAEAEAKQKLQREQLFDLFKSTHPQRYLHTEEHFKDWLALKF